MLVAELFFGRDIRGRAPLSDAEWADFAARRHAELPRWLHRLRWLRPMAQPADRRIARDPTKILLVAAKRPPISPAASRR